jgi:hypothetical protein
MQPRFAAIIETRQPLGAVAGRAVGELFSMLRTLLFDRFIDIERSYRGTLLGFHHGLSTARLLRDVAERLDEPDTVDLLETWLREREPLIETAERELHWFAESPRKAIRSGLRLSFEPDES